jgi:hypothetical protein
MLSRIVQYFNDCYRADNREQNIWDIFSKNNEFLNIHNSDDLHELHDKGTIEVDAEYGALLRSSIATYRREKTFLYCHYFISGKITNTSGLGAATKRICAPLVVFDTTIEKVGSKYFIRLDPTSSRWNTSVLSILVNNNESMLKLDAALEAGDYQNPHWIADWLKRHNATGSEIDTIEQLVDRSQLESHRRKTAANKYTIIAGGAMLLAKRSPSSRGIIDELNSIAEEPSGSLPLKYLFNQNVFSIPRFARCDLDNIPGILSSAQSMAVKNAAQSDFSVIVGPPGTGKSYTIACIVLERFMQGQSVLVVSQNEYAVDVIHDKLLDLLGVSSSAIIRAGDKDYIRHLKQYIGDLVKGIGLKRTGPGWQSKLKRIKRKIGRSERRFSRISGNAISDGIYLDKVVSGTVRQSIISNLKLWFQRRRIAKYGLLFDLLCDIQQKQRLREDILSKHINHTYQYALNKLLVKHRKEFVKFNSAIRSRTSLTQEARFSEINFSILLEAFPIWLCSLSSLHKVLPLKKELFDLVIIDEATQCNMASCIPALYRARRAVIVGDPKQLRHISFLSRQKQDALKRKHNLDSEDLELNYRDKSAIDFADQAISSQDDLVLLNEHYRSVPEIIDFSNRKFYSNSLRIMTEKPVLHKDPPVEVINVNNGRRIDGINITEAETVIEKLKELIDDQKKLPVEYKLSIGVLSFFRDQANEIQQIIFREFDLDVISQHKIRAGTPYAFQGEERDIMLISCAVDSEENSGTYRYLNRADVFNVSITRARDLQLLYLSTDASKLPNDNLLRLYVESVNQRNIYEYSHNLERDKNIEELSTELTQQGMKVLTSYPIAGITMDLVVMYGSYTLALDLVGFPGEYQDVLHIDRYKIFERAGLEIFPLSYTAWIYEKPEVIKKIQSTFLELNSKDVTRISVQHISSHWVKLLAANPEIARLVRSLEFDLVDEGLDEGLDQLGNVIDRYRAMIWVLGQKLNPSELTYTRYINVAEQVLLGVIDNLKKVVLISRSAEDKEAGQNLTEKHTAILEDREQSIGQLIAKNAEAIMSLDSIAMKWSKLDTGKEHSDVPFDVTLKELDRLDERVDSYSA